MDFKQVGAVANLELALNDCRKAGLSSWETAMQVQSLISHWANSEGFEVKVTVVKK